MICLMPELWTESAALDGLAEAPSPDVEAGCGTAVIVSPTDGPERLTR